MADTTQRVLRILGLLQARPIWTSEQLAERTGITTRTVRRDVERLRDLGYPIEAVAGVGGGYRLGNSGRMPPLLLDDEEAVAVAVSLRMAAGDTVSGVNEAALRTLSKLDQVLPPRLRGQVAALKEATLSVVYPGPVVDPEALIVLARGVRESVRCRFGYLSASGERSERDVEPYKMVSTGRRWYLMAFDLDRDDWRSFRLDRISEPRTTTFRYRPRPAPEPEEFIRGTQRGTRSQETIATVRFDAPVEVVTAHIPSVYARATALGAGGTELEVYGDRIDDLVRPLAWAALDLGAEMTVVTPPELAEKLRQMGERILRFAR